MPSPPIDSAASCREPPAAIIKGKQPDFGIFYDPCVIDSSKIC